LKSKLAITVTTLHQSKFSKTQLGAAHGYGVDDKKTAEDILIQDLMSQASLRYRNMTTSDEDALAIMVPELPKKPARPVDA